MIVFEYTKTNMFKFIKIICLLICIMNLGFNKSVLKTIRIKSVHYLEGINDNQDRNQNYID